MQDYERISRNYLQIPKFFRNFAANLERNKNMAQERLIIGSDFDIEGIGYKDGSGFDAAPYVVLHSQATRKYFGVVAVEDTDKDTYKVHFPAATTNKMSEGSYDLEVYADSTRTELIAEIAEDYVYASHGAGSSLHTNGN